MTSDRLSVVINTYNRAPSLPATLDGLTRQVDGDFEVVVVNGPSSDGTSDILATWGDAIRVVDIDEVHLGKSRNAGIQAAAGDIVAFIDDDAVPESDWVSGLKAAYIDDQVAGAGGIVIDHTGVSLQYRFSACSRIGNPRFDLVAPFDEFMFPGADPFMYLQGTNCSFRRDRLAEIGGFDETIEYYLDEVEVCMQLIDRGHRLAPIDGAAVHHHYLPSHLRSSRTTWTHPYPVVKNRYYFALAHGCTERSTGEVLLELNAWSDGVIGSGRRELAAAGDAERIDAYVEQVHRGVADGVALGLAGVRQSVEIGAPTGEYRRFPTIVGEQSRRYCFVSGEYPPAVGGVGRFTADTARGLAANGHEVHVVTRTDGVHRVEIEQGVWLHRVPIQDRYIPATEASPLRFNFEHCAALYHEVDRLHRRRPIDLVSAPIWNCEGLLPSLDRRFPTVTTLVTTIEKVLEILPSWNEIDHIRSLAALEAETLRRAPFIHANSTATERSALERTDGSVHLAHFGLDDPSPGIEAVQRDDDSVELLFVGRLERRKGIDLLLEALPGLLDQFPTLRARIIGRDTPSTEMELTYREDFVQRLSSRPDLLDRVVFEGEVDDDEVRAAYASCDIFCAPSRYESFGLVLLEAMSFSKPVVACDEGGMADLVDDNGILVPIDDADALSEALQRLIGDDALRAEMGRRGRELFDQRWRLDHAVARTDELYGSIAAAWDPSGDGVDAAELAEVLVAAGSLEPVDAAAASRVFLSADRSPLDLIRVVVRLLLHDDAHLLAGLYPAVLGRPAEDWELEVQRPFLAGGGSPLDLLAGLAGPNSSLGVGWEQELVPQWSAAVRQQLVWALDDPDDHSFVQRLYGILLRREARDEVPGALAELAAGLPRTELVRRLALGADARRSRVPVDWLDEVAPPTPAIEQGGLDTPTPPAPGRTPRRLVGAVNRLATDLAEQSSRDHHVAQRLDQIEQRLAQLATLVAEGERPQPSLIEPVAPSADERDSSAAERERLIARRVDELTRQQHSGFDMLTGWLDVLSRKQEAMALELRERLPAGPDRVDLPVPVIVGGLDVQSLAERDGGRLRVNLGAGEKPIEGYINTDARELPGIDVVADIRSLPFEPGTLDELNSEHLIEHFRFHELRTVILPYWRGLLSPEGRIRIVCPDLAALVAGAATGDLSMDELAVAAFGLQDYSGDDHLALYTADSLAESLIGAGFVDVDIVATGRRNGGTYEMELTASRGTDMSGDER